MSVISSNGISINTQKQEQIKALNVLPSIVVGCVLLSPVSVCPFEHKISPLDNFVTQKEILNHFNKKNILKADVFNSTTKKLEKETVDFIKKNKKIHLKPILTRTAGILGIIGGLYLISYLAINHLQNKNR